MPTILPEPEPYYRDDAITLYLGDALHTLQGLPDQSVDCCVTSPPYFGLRDYGTEGQYGLEASPAEYVETMRALFAEVRRVLTDDGTLWVNIGDSYARAQETNVPQTKNRAVSYPEHSKTGSSDGAVGRASRPGSRATSLRPKNLLGIPWRTAFALQEDGWILRNEVIWHKPNAMPESVTDRLSNRHEHLFMLTKSPRYWFDLGPIREPSCAPEARAVRKGSAEAWNAGTGLSSHMGHRGAHEEGRNPGDVWSVTTQPFSAAHFATFPPLLPERCVLAGCKPGGTVLDPFSGSGTTGMVAQKHGRKYVGIDLSAEYLDLSLRTRFAQPGFNFGEASA